MKTAVGPPMKKNCRRIWTYDKMETRLFTSENQKVPFLKYILSLNTAKLLPWSSTIIVEVFIIFNQINILWMSSLGNLLLDDNLCIAISLSLGACLCVSHQMQMWQAHGQQRIASTLGCGSHPCHAELNSIFKRAFQSLAIPSIL